MTLRQLYYFQTLSKLLHYTKAAEALHISQPSLSYMITELEKEFGTSFFERDGKKIKLSPAGEIFLDYVNQSLSILESGKNAVSQYVNNQTNNINIGYIHTIPTSFIDSALNTFQNDARGKYVSFCHTISNVNNSLLEDLSKGKISFAFCLDLNSEIEGVPICNQDLYVLVSKNHPLGKFKEVDFEDLEDLPFVRIVPANSLHRSIAPEFHKRQVSPNISYEAGNFAVAISYVIRFNCYMIAPHLSTVDSSQLTMLTIRDVPLSRPIYFAWKKNSTFTKTEKQFKDFITSSNFENVTLT